VLVGQAPGWIAQPPHAKIYDFDVQVRVGDPGPAARGALSRTEAVKFVAGLRADHRATLKIPLGFPAYLQQA
jgi:hypothetical protein